MEKTSTKFERAGVFDGMVSPQRERIERQRKLVARLERDGLPDLSIEAVRLLGEMERALAQMKAD
jgi:hypothetical protein